MSTTGTARTGARGPDPARRLGRRVGAGALGALMAMGALPLVATQATASLTGPGVGAGRNITVFHNIDMVAITGYGPGGSVVTVDVIRAGVRIGTASGPTVDTEEGAVLEINHGVDGTPVAGDCWTGTTPDIRPGDRIVVTLGGDVDEVTVDDIRFTGAPEAQANGDVVLYGIAKRADGTAIPPAALDSGEFRDTTGELRAAPTRVEANPAVAGGFIARYTAPYTLERNRNNLTAAQIKSALLTQDGHAIGFGHTDPLPLESMLVDGLGDVTGPADGCGGVTPDPDPDPDPVDTTPPPAPTVNPNTGTYTSAQSVTMTDAEDGAVIRYTVGTGTTVPADPTATSPRYTGPINVTASQVIKAAAFDAAGNRSPVTRRNYTITAPTTTTRTLVLTATADTMARESSPTSKYGSTNPLKSDTRATDSSRSRETAYLKFAIPALQAGETITGASLRLHVTNSTTNGPTVYRTATGWSESSMTWRSGQPSRSSSTASGNFGSLGTGGRSTGLSLTGLGPSRTVSFQLYADSSDGLSFSSRESGTSNNRPQLVLVIQKS